MTQDQAEREDGGGGLGVSTTDTARANGVGVAAGRQGRSDEAAAPWAGEDWALVVGSGSDLAELYDQIVRLPAGLEFVEAFGDVDLVLVYRPGNATPSRGDLLNSLVEQVVEHGGMLVGPVSPDGLSAGERYTTASERAAFAAGQADALRALRRALTGTISRPPSSRSALVTS